MTNRLPSSAACRSNSLYPAIGFKEERVVKLKIEGINERDHGKCWMVQKRSNHDHYKELKTKTKKKREKII